MPTTDEITIKITGVDKASVPIDRVRKAVQDVMVTSDKSTDKLKKQTKTLDDGFKQAGRGALKLKGIIAGLAAATGLTILTWQIKKLASASIDIASNFERLQISLDTITKGRGDEWFERLNTWALKMPVNTEKAIQTFTMLRAMGLQPTIKDMTILVDTSSALGGSADTLEGIGRALGQIATKGKVSAEELMQLAERGIPAYEILRQKLNLTAEQVANIGNEAIDGREAVRALLEGMEERFGGQSARMMDTWSGMMESLRSYWKEFTRQVMESGPFQVMREQLKELVKWVDEARENGRFQQWINSWAITILDVFRSGMEAGRLFFQTVIEGFQQLNNLSNRWREIFASVVGNFAENRLETLRKERESLIEELRDIDDERTIAGRLRPEGYTDKIRERIGILDTEIAKWRVNRQAAVDMFSAADDEMGTFNRRIDETQRKLDALAEKFRKGIADAIKAGAEEPVKLEYLEPEEGLGELISGLRSNLQKRLQVIIKHNQEALADVKKRLESELTLQEQLADKVKQIRQGMRDDEKSTEEMLRGLRRETMTEEELWADRRAEVDEKYSQSRRALLMGDLELAKQLAREGQRVALSLAQEVKTEKGETIIAKALGLEEAEKLIKDGGKIVQNAWKEQEWQAEQSFQEQAEKVKPLQEQFNELTKKLEEFQKQLKNLSQEDVSLTIELTNLNQVEQNLKRLERDLHATLTVTTQQVQASSTGGPVMALAGGGMWSRIRGHLPGFGGGDRIRAMLEAGEYVIRKEVVRNLGAGFFDFLNRIGDRLPNPPTMPTAPVPAFAAGGAVGAVPFLGRIDWHIGGEKIEAYMPMEEAERLERVMTRIRKTRV